MSRAGKWPHSGFSVRLRTMREEVGWTRQQLADAAGCHPQTVVKLEAGEHEPAWPLVLLLARALGVSTEMFRPEDERSEE